MYRDFLRFAGKFQAENGRPAVLVFDNMNLIAQKSPDTLHGLQGRAKYAVDKSLHKVVFVCSDGLAPAVMNGKSIGDLPGAHNC